MTVVRSRQLQADEIRTDDVNYKQMSSSSATMLFASTAVSSHGAGGGGRGLEELHMLWVLAEVLLAHHLFDKIPRRRYIYRLEEEVILCKVKQATKHTVY